MDFSTLTIDDANNLKLVNDDGMYAAKPLNHQTQGSPPPLQPKMH
jgi:hypothetical protein